MAHMLLPADLHGCLSDKALHICNPAVEIITAQQSCAYQSIAKRPPLTGRADRRAARAGPTLTKAWSAVTVEVEVVAILLQSGQYCKLLL